MRSEAPGRPAGVDPEVWKRWKPDAQSRALSLIREREQVEWRPFYCKNRQCNGQPHRWPRDARECPGRFGHEWDKDIDYLGCKHCGVESDPLDEWQFPHGRVDQRPPNWRHDWLTLLLRGGRGSGKTRTGAEITNKVTEITSRIILIAATGPDLRNTMVEGVSGILATAAPGKRPEWEPSKKRLTWPNGCIAEGFSAEEPDRLRGPQSGYVWGDEPSHWPLVRDVWDNMLFGLRIPGKHGYQPKIVATSTPKPNEWTKEMVAAEDTIDRVVSTYANLGNLAKTYKNTVIKRYEGSRTGLQELEGQLLEDVEGALWTYGIINHVDDHPILRRTVVAIDPAGTANKRSDETGIITCAVGGHDKHFYVLSDESGKYSPSAWANTAIDTALHWDADAIVYEKNYGGEMVERVLTAELERRGLQHRFRLIAVTSRKGKDVRAEPIVALYEKAEVFHVGARGDLEKLEEEMTTWVPHPPKGTPAMPSPNRIDALVHGLTDLAKMFAPAAVSNPNILLKHMRTPRNRHLG